jgi:hypothetical protein
VFSALSVRDAKVLSLIFDDDLPSFGEAGFDDSK